MPCARFCILALFCAALSFMTIIEGRATEHDRTRDFLRSEEAGRLRRGFQTSSLATARGFGKRGGPGTIPFVSNPLQVQEPFYQHPKGGKEAVGSLWEQVGSNDRLYTSYPLSFLADFVASRPNLLMSLLEQFVDRDGDGYITSEELERLQ